jgi:protein O-GlcNAc transferase
VLDAPAKSAAEMLPAYNRVDIALDTMPYSGMTTTCEALFMGVPVVTMAGQISGARVSESIIRAVLGDASLVASDDESYVSLAVGLAKDRARLAALRSSLRGTFQSSPVGDAKGFAARFEKLVRDMWRARCAQA